MKYPDLCIQFILFMYPYHCGNMRRQSRADGTAMVWESGGCLLACACLPVSFGERRVKEEQDELHEEESA